MLPFHSTSPRRPYSKPAASAALRPLCLLCGVLLAAPALADGYHYADAIVGGRAAGMGGAMVGVSGDPSAAYYNPAGLSRSAAPEVSLSADALEVKSLTLAPYLGGAATEHSVGIVPNASVGSTPWQGGRVAFSVFTTQADDLVLDSVFSPPALSGIRTARVRRIENESTHLIGPSLGMPASDVLSLGVSAFYVYRSVSLRLNEYHERTSATEGEIGAYEHNVDSDQVSQGLVVVAGVLVQPGGEAGRFKLGLALRSGASLADTATRREENLVGTVQPDGSLLFSRQPLISSEEARSAMPSAVSAGASVRLASLLLAADASVYSAQSYVNLGAQVTKLLTANGAIGAEWAVDETWTGRAGAYSNRSAAPRVVDDSGPAPAHVDVYGLTVGLSRGSEHHVEDFAVKLARAFGQDKVPGQGEVLQRAEVSGWEFAFTLGGSYRF